LVACGSSASGTPATATTPPAPPGAPPSAPPASTSCTPDAAADVVVAANDLNGFPPYAISGCSLVYVAKGGALVLRDLTTRAETTIAEAADSPRRPTIAGDVIAWEAGSSVRVRANGTTTTIAGAFVAAGEPRAGGRIVAFTAWLAAPPNGDTDVLVYDVDAAAISAGIGGPAQQRFADTDGVRVAATDLSEDPDGRYDGDGTDLADIAVFDRTTQALVKRAMPGKQAFPMLAAGDRVAYLSWNEVHPEPKLVEYVLRSGTIAADPATDVTIADVKYVSDQYARPAVHGATLEWIANPDGVTAMWRAPVDGSAAPAKVSGLEGLTLYAPAPSDDFSVVAAVATAAPDPKLVVVPR
jgi:hypothetical protein